MEVFLVNKSESIADFAAAMAKVQAEIGGAVKGNVNPAFKSKYADLSAVWEAWQPIGPKHGFAVMQFPGVYDAEARTMGMDQIITHSSGQWIEGSMTIPLTKQDAQGYGSACTYARRYALSAGVGICPEDDDGNGAVARPSQRQDVAPSQSNVEPIATGRKPPERLKGPIKTRAELRTACGDFVRDLHACGDADQFAALMTTSKSLIDQVRDEHQLYWEGDGADFLGLKKEIDRMQVHFDQEADEHTERWRTDARAAG
jgi:hypothetical protein